MRRRIRHLLVALVAMYAAPGCRENVAPPPPSDTTPPRLAVVFPTGQSAVDRDSDALVDIELTWSDSESGVDPASLRITCPNGGPGCAPGTDLVTSWVVKRADSTGATIEEGFTHLLGSGLTKLQVSVADHAGNRSQPTDFLVNLPKAQFSRSVSLSGPGCQFARPIGIALTPDGRKAIVADQGCATIFDPDSLAMRHVLYPVPFGTLPALDPATHRVYFDGGGGPLVSVFDYDAEQFVAQRGFGASLAGIGLQGGRLFLGTFYGVGDLMVLDAATLDNVGSVHVGLPPGSGENSTEPNVEDVAFANGVGYAAGPNVGIVRFDPQTLSVLAHQAVGNIRSIAVVGGRIYAAALGNGLKVYDATTLTQVGEWSEQGVSVVDLAVSPDSSLLVLSAWHSAGFPPITHRTPVVLALPGLQVIAELPPRGSDVSDGVTFHPDGRRFFLLAEDSVAEYLVRP